MERELKKYMNDTLGTKDVDYVIAIDTDSIYLRMGELVKLAKKSISTAKRLGEIR